MAAEGTRLVAELRDLRSELADTVAALEALERSCVLAEAALEAGAAPTEVYRTSGWGATRDQCFTALDRFSQQLTRVRAEAIRLHVDVEGRTFTEVATLIGRSRQFVTRLYRQAHQD